MSQPHVTFRLPDGGLVPVGPGGLIGRMPTAALSIDDPRISEAHAMVSLRGGDLLLLTLRGGLSVGRRKVVRVTLQEGMRVELVPGIELEVAALELPSSLLALSLDGGPPVALVAAAYSLELEPEPRLDPSLAEGAWATLWTTAAEGWRIRLRGEEPRRLDATFRAEVGGRRIRALLVPATAAGVAPTLARPDEASPLQLVLRYDTVHIHRQGQPSVHVPGIPARVLTELGRFAAPVPWEMVARTIWKEERDRFVLRQNWDRHIKALRGRLREAGVRSGLVRADGLGNIELFLRPDDRMVDES